MALLLINITSKYKNFITKDLYYKKKIHFKNMGLILLWKIYDRK